MMKSRKERAHRTSAFGSFHVADPEVPEPLSLAVRPLASLVSTVLTPARRLYKERSAGLVPVAGQTGPPELGRFFDGTLSRLSEGQVEAAWWQNLLARAGHALVAPDFLQRPDLQAWLKDDQVRADFKALAGARILDTSEAPEIRSRLRERYAAVTSEAEYLADEPIEVFVAILLAAFAADLGPTGERLTWVTLESDKQTRAELARGFEEVYRRFDNLSPDRLVEDAHNKQVSETISQLLQRRAWDPIKAREQIQQLLARVQSGDLRHASPEVQKLVLYWAARLHTGWPEHIEQVKSFRDQLRQLYHETDTRIIDALIKETEGDGEGALRILRDIDDPDARATLFSVLYKVRGPEGALAWFNGQERRQHLDFLNGRGWYAVAVALAQTNRWEDAKASLAEAHALYDEWPDLLFLEGVVNAALLLPSELRPHALDMNLLHPEVHTLEGPEADQHRERAIFCFRQAEELMAVSFPDRASVAKSWLLWLRLTHSDSVVHQAAMAEVREQMRDPEQALSLLPMARAFGIPFYAEFLKNWLAERAAMGGLEDSEIQARFMLAEMTSEPADLITFLEEEETSLRRVLPAGLLSGVRIEALVKDGQASKARSLLEERNDEFEEADRQRLEAIIEEGEGQDPRPRLEELYEESGELIDLQNLARHLRRVRDWSALRPHLEELFRRERTRQNALQLVACMQQNPESDEADVLTFLEANLDLVEGNPDLISARAWALFRTGRLDEARAINDRLLSERNHPSDLQLDINLALQSGAWERFSGIVEREWEKREELQPKDLIQLASLAAESSTSASRAFDLLRLAVEKGCDDPNILAAAISLAYRLGREDEELREWLSRAVALSSDEGPLKTFDLRTLAEEWMPADRERRNTIQERWLQGEIPLHMAASGLNVPLSYLFIGLPRSNAPLQDGRRRTLIPIVSGARQPVVVQPEWTVGLDVTSLMIFNHLGLLDKVLESFKQVVLAPETMLLLLNERNRVRFHQPSRVRKAEELLVFLGTGQLRSTEPLPTPLQWLSDEVGTDLAQLLQAARESQGVVVRPRPIHKLRSLMEEEAQLGDYENLLVSMSDFERFLYSKGILDAQTHEQASRFLLSQEQGKSATPEAAPFLSGPFYIDALALTYLQSAGLLTTLAASGLDLRVHPSTQQEQISLTESNRQGEQLSGAIENLRITLREALYSGKVSFLPRHNPTEEEEWLSDTAPTLGQFLKDVGPCDAVCIDDRYVTKHSMFSDRRGKNVAVLCVLDVLRHLEAQGALAVEERYSALHKLRQSGFVFVPVEPEELKRLLISVPWNTNGTFVESAELRIIRQSLARIRSLNMLRLPEEMEFLGQLRRTSALVIYQLWAEEALPVERARYLADWVWHHVSPFPLDWHESNNEALALHLSFLLVSLPAIPEERRQSFLTWIEERVLEPLQPVHSEVLDHLARLMAQQIEHWSEEYATGEESADG